jgi:hypothetical protein
MRQSKKTPQRREDLVFKLAKENPRKENPWHEYELCKKNLSPLCGEAEVRQIIKDLKV